MKQIRIVTDGGADLPKEISEQYGIEILKMAITIDDTHMTDSDSLTPLELYDGMRKGRVYKTAQVPLEEFLTAFSDYADADTPMIYIALSSGLSGTYNTALMAVNMVREDHPNWKSAVIDSKGASAGYSCSAVAAARMVAEGKDFDTIVNYVTFIAEHMKYVFTVDKLEYLVRGGRLSKAAAAVAGALNIKPIIAFDELGRLEPVEKVRGMKKTYKRMIQIVKEQAAEPERQTALVLHADCLPVAEEIADTLKTELGFANTEILMVGATIGAHAGPGTLGILYLGQLPK